MEYSLFLYGFPYNRGWEEIRNYLDEVGAHTFYKSDNVTIGEYYDLGIYTNSTDSEYFVHVLNNQEFRKYKLRKNYIVDKEIFVENKLEAVTYKRLD